MGSSPRVWGQVYTICYNACFVRIIPTRVGTRKAFGSDNANFRDHPHACGDKIYVGAYLLPQIGSSPRVWGQEGRPVSYSIGERIIPTRVGTRPKKITQKMVDEDHPHACGDKSGTPRQIHTSEGSSPRVWGQENYSPERAETTGIIPTRVGTRLKKSRKIAVLQNQPLRFPLTFHRSFV